MSKSKEFLTLIAPCYQANTTVKIKAPQQIKFSLPINSCDGCIVRFIKNENTDLYQSIEIIEPEFRGKCTRKLGNDRVDFID